MKKRWRTIVIDPPWPGPGSCPVFAQGHSGPVPKSIVPYSCMTWIQCAALRIRELAAADAQLWLWTTSRNAGDAFLLAQLWGFQYRALFVWLKPTLGLGRHVRHQTEFLLWAARPGARRNPPKATPRQVHQWRWTRRHSEKPAEAYQMIAQLSDAPRLDIFARQKRPGFTPWGNEAPHE